MEKRQAVEFLEYLRQDRNLERTIYGDALNIAIDALKTQLSQQGTTSDLISRQAVINAIENTNAKMSMPEWDEITNAVMSLPTVQLKPKEGEWVQIQRCVGDTQPDLECPFCKHRIGWFDMGRYCAGCGAKLEGGAG